MVDKSHNDKQFQSIAKQENESFPQMNWHQFDDQGDDYKHSNSTFMNKFGTMSRHQPIFPDYNPLAINQHEYGNDTINFQLQHHLNPPMLNDPEQSIRNNSQFPMMNDKQYMANPIQQQEFNQGNQQKYPQYEFLNGMNKMQNYPNAVQNYIPLNNAIRRPLPPELVDEEPVYVNPKQYERIMKLRIKKAKKGIVKNTVTPIEKTNKSYKHESRHQHAKKRERGSGGRFLSKEELEKKRKEDEEKELEQQNQVGQIDLPINGDKPPVDPSGQNNHH